MPCPAADIFRQAAQVNRDDPCREGNVVHVSAGCEALVCGDIHGHRPSLARALAYADLPRRDDRRLILQEIVHAPPDAASGHDRSIELLMRVARLKLSQPSKVFFLLSNHDVAQITANEITKDGRGACKAFDAGVRHAFGQDAEEVLGGVSEFLMSLPLAARCPNGAFIAHSLPSAGRMEAAGTEILQRPYTPDDLRRGGPVYEWTWGRHHTPEHLDRLAAELDVSFFVVGHQRLENGHEPLCHHGLVLNSDNERGVLLHFDSDEPLTTENVLEHLTPLIAIRT